MPYIRHLDWLGSARLSTTWSHTVQSKVAYAPFGETYNEAGASSNDRSFTGQEQDTVTGNAATGIYDFLFRKYDPAAGRWLSPDPSGWGAVSQDDPQSLDRYAYVENEPLQAFDPNGLSCVQNNIYDGNGNLVSVTNVDNGDGQGCAEAGVAPSTPQDPSGTNDGTPGVTVIGNDPCNGNPNCVVVNPPLDCNFQCQLAYSNSISQLQSEGLQVYVVPASGQPGISGGGGTLGCTTQVVLCALGAAFGAKAPGSDPGGEVADQVKESSKSPIVWGAVVTTLGRVSARVGAFAGDDLLPVVGWGASAFIAYHAVKDAVQNFNENIGSCQ
jgi:RHS repeat-associated protein